MEEAEGAHMESIHIPLLSFSSKPIFQIIIGFAGLKFNFLFDLASVLLELDEFHGGFQAHWPPGKLRRGLGVMCLEQGKKTEVEKLRGKVKISLGHCQELCPAMDLRHALPFPR